MIILEAFLIWYSLGILLSLILIFIEGELTLFYFIALFIISLGGPLLIFYLFTYLIHLLDNISLNLDYTIWKRKNKKGENK